jgi:catechol 2,3-dioxygenase-like lactoylglutathione lyase family enzyme
VTVLGVDHASVTVRDLGESVRFYHDLLGLPVLGSGEEEAELFGPLVGQSNARFRYADLDLGGGHILELLQYLHPAGTPRETRVFDPGTGHLGLRVDDLDEALRRLAASGVRPPSTPIELAEPAWWRGARVVYVNDPDGAVIELVERPSSRVAEKIAAAVHQDP